MGRVLVVCAGVVPGPDRLGVQVGHVLKALASRFSVDVLTLRSGDLPYVERLHKTRMLRVPVPEKGDSAERLEAFGRAVGRQLEGAEYDLVHALDPFAARAAFVGTQRLGLRLVCHFGFSPHARVDEAAVSAVRGADLVIVASDAAAAHIAQLGRHGPTVVIPPGVDVDLFDHEPGIADGPPRVLASGPVLPGAPLSLLVQAIALVHARTPVTLLLAGSVDPVAQASLDAAVRARGPQPWEILGSVLGTEMPRAIASAAVCVVPSASVWSDHPLPSFPTKILEAMACRRPVVAPRVDSVAQVIEDKVDGLLFRPGDPQDLAAQIVRLLGDPALRERLVETAYHRVRERFPASAARRLLLQAVAPYLRVPEWRPQGDDAVPAAATGNDESASTLVGAPIPEMADDDSMVTSPHLPPSPPAPGRPPVFAAGEIEALTGRTIAPARFEAKVETHGLHDDADPDSGVTPTSAPRRG